MENNEQGLTESQKKQVQQLIKNYRPTFLMRMEKFYDWLGRNWRKFISTITTKKGA